MDTLGIINEMVDYLFEDGQELVIACIGTDKVIADSLAPMVGTLLTEMYPGYPIFGTLDFPIHARNLDDRLDEIDEKHPNAFIIGIDAAIGTSETLNNVCVRSRGVRPGKGLGKRLQTVGDMCIMGVVVARDDDSVAESLTDIEVRFSMVYNMAKRITNALIPILNKYVAPKLEAAITIE